MFDFEKPEDGSEGRYHARIETFEEQQKPVIKHHVWWLMHNCVAHPLMGLMPVKVFFDFHDYTSRKIHGQ
jgi:hypothetical protein